MKKGRAITLLSILCAVLAFVLVMTFIRFPVGIYNYNSVIGAIDKDFDYDGGKVYYLKLSNDNTEEVGDIKEVVKTLGLRLDALGYKGYSVNAVKNVQDGVAESEQEFTISVSLKSNDNTASDMQVITAYGSLEFFGGTSANPTTPIMEDISVIENATANGTSCAITFTNQGYDALSSLIKQAEKDGGSYYLSIKLGDTALFDGSSAISTSYFNKRTIALTTGSEQGAKQLALQIRTGGLAYKYEFMDLQGETVDVSNAGFSISPILGESAGTLSVIGVAVVIALVSVFFFIAFRKFGFVALLTMLSFILAETAMLIAVPGIVFSVSGLLGVILSSVITADGLMILGKRITEEAEKGKTVKAALKAGLSRSFIPTLLITGISALSALFLFIFVGGAYQAFAIALGIGSVIAFIADVVLSRMWIALIFPLCKNSFIKNQKAVD